MARPLTEKQKKFAENKYILRMNGKDSARAAGYKEGALDSIAHENTRKPSLREYALEKIREKNLPDSVIEMYKEVLINKASKGPTYQDKIAVGREIAQIEGHYAPKRHEKITLTGTFDAMTMAQKLVKLEELKQRLLLESSE